MVGSVNEVVVAGEEDDVLGFDPPTEDGVGQASRTRLHDVLHLMAFRPEAPRERKREVLVEEEPHEVDGTAGGWWAATCAA